MKHVTTYILLISMSAFFSACGDKEPPSLPPKTQKPSTTVDNIIESSDKTPPAWSKDFKIGVMLKDATDNAQGIVLTWDSATDNDAVAKYTLSRNGKVLSSLPPQARSFHVTSTPFNGSYSLSACDKSDNCAVAPLKTVDMSVLRRTAIMGSILSELVAKNASAKDAFKNPKEPSLNVNGVDLSKALNQSGTLTDLDLAQKMGLDKLGADIDLLKSGALGSTAAPAELAKPAVSP